MKKESKIYNQAPLPFQGQKRRFLKELRAVLQEYNEEFVFIDLFGGSGLLSHTVKEVIPNARVIYNDFDNYYQRLRNISSTNRLLSTIRTIIGDFPRDKRLPDEIRTQILKYISLFEKEGFVDYVTLSSSLLFSASYVTNFKDLSKCTFYNVVKRSDYNADGYLRGVSRVQMDYELLYRKYNHLSKVVWLVDPPYLSTDCSTYKSDKFWTLKDYLNVLQVLERHAYVYFTSNKSSIVELCEWIALKTPKANPFANAHLKTIKVGINYNSSYTDMMYFRYPSST